MDAGLPQRQLLNRHSVPPFKEYEANPLRHGVWKYLNVSVFSKKKQQKNAADKTWGRTSSHTRTQADTSCSNTAVVDYLGCIVGETAAGMFVWCCFLVKSKPVWWSGFGWMEVHKFVGFLFKLQLFYALIIFTNYFYEYHNLKNISYSARYLTSVCNRCAPEVCCWLISVLC